MDPLALAACTKAHGNKAPELDGEADEPYGIDELRIARVVRADGTRQYLSRRPRRHYTDA
ncbi:hypothetical protein BF49_4636 [Bradyrhizobium sp.]|nr:hypothetical protein BF49_4636 [Bradyrhizobium sp.]